MMCKAGERLLCSMSEACDRLLPPGTQAHPEVGVHEGQCTSGGPGRPQNVCQQGSKLLPRGQHAMCFESNTKVLAAVCKNTMEFFCGALMIHCTLKFCST